MTSSENPTRDRRTISCPMVPNSAQLAGVSTASGRDTPPAYNSSTYPQPNSPAARKFFSAITQRVRSRSRSLSCSRGSPPPPSSDWQDAGTSTGGADGKGEDILGSPLTKTASPTAMSPQIAANSSPTSPTVHKDRHSNSLPVRPSARGESRSGSGNGNGSGTFTQYGRHSNEWLFNGYSVTGTVREMLERRRS